jgi:serine protease Do
VPQLVRGSLLLVFLAAAATLAAAEIITLNEGQTVRGEVVREYPDRVIVDVGFDLLSIPRSSIRSIDKEEAVQPKSGEVVETTQHLYSKNPNLAPDSVKNLTERFGEGVVLVSSPGGLGSGFFISEEGHLITNFHVIEGETKLAVQVFRKVDREFKREKFEDVDIVAVNPFLDLALLKVNLPAGYKPVITYLAAEDHLRDGDRVFAIGNPLGLERSVSEGIVSRKNRAEQGLAYIQTTTQINPGNSGGPLFNSRGEVVGVTNMKIIGGEGLGFAIPVRYVIDFLTNRDAFAYNSEASVAGFRYLQPPERQKREAPPLLKKP